MRKTHKHAGILLSQITASCFMGGVDYGMGDKDDGMGDGMMHEVIDRETCESDSSTPFGTENRVHHHRRRS